MLVAKDANGVEQSLTKRQMEMFRLIRRHIIKHDCGPSVPYLAKAMNCRHDNVRRMVNKLVKKGVIDCGRKKSTQEFDISLPKRPKRKPDEFPMLGVVLGHGNVHFGNFSLLFYPGGRP